MAEQILTESESGLSAQGLPAKLKVPLQSPGQASVSKGANRAARLSARAWWALPTCRLQRLSDRCARPQRQPALIASAWRRQGSRSPVPIPSSVPPRRAPQLGPSPLPIAVSWSWTPPSTPSANAWLSTRVRLRQSLASATSTAPPAPSRCRRQAPSSLRPVNAEPGRTIRDQRHTPAGEKRRPTVTEELGGAGCPTTGPAAHSRFGASFALGLAGAWLCPAAQAGRWRLLAASAQCQRLLPITASEPGWVQAPAARPSQMPSPITARQVDATFHA